MGTEHIAFSKCLIISMAFLQMCAVPLNYLHCAHFKSFFFDKRQDNIRPGSTAAAHSPARRLWDAGPGSSSQGLSSRRPLLTASY